MSAITVRQAVLSDLEALVPLFDGYRQFYGRDSNLGAARDFLAARFNRGESVLFIPDNPLAEMKYSERGEAWRIPMESIRENHLTAMR